MRGDQLARQWQLIQRLARSRGGVNPDALAEELEVTRRTVYRDLDALQYAGFPVLTEKRGGRVFYRFLDSFGLGDVPFTTDEVLALAFSEDLLRALEGTVFHDSIASALQKIRAAMGPEVTGFLARLGESFRVLPGPHKTYASQRDAIGALNEAVLGRRTVRMRYRTGRTGEVATRRLDPYAIWYRSGGLYAIGFDHKRGEVRTFAVDRMSRVEVTDERFERRPDFDFDEYVRGAFGVVAEPAVSVRIRFAPERALQIEEREWHASQRLEREEGGSIVLALEVGSTTELRDWILSFGPDAEVLEPASLRADVESRLKSALSRYADVP